MRRKTVWRLIVEQKINKCQFCGGIAKIAGRKLRYVTCTSCHAQGPRCALIDDAITGWNSIKKDQKEEAESLDNKKN